MKNRIYWVCLIIGVLFLVNKANPKMYYFSDALLKVVQAKSLIINKYKSEEIYYPASNIDPSFSFYPLAHVSQLEEQYIGAFPVFLSLLTSGMIYVAGFKSAPYLILIFVFLPIIILRKFWNVSNVILSLALFCTPFLYHGHSFFDVALSNFFTFFGLSILLIENISISHQKETLRMLAGGGVFGMAVWLRLEAVIFFVALYGALFAVDYKTFLKKRSSYLFLTGFMVSVFIFLTYNYISYANFLGPRFIANKTFVFDITKRLTIIRSTLIYGNMRVGFFGYVPGFLFLLLFFTLKKNRIYLEKKELVLLVLLYIYIPIVAIVSPNDSNIDWGTRYLSMSILPLVVLSQSFYEKFILKVGSKKLKAIAMVLCIFSFGVSSLIYKQMKVVAKQLALAQKDFNTLPSDIWLFKNITVAGHMGLNYFSKKSLLVERSQSLMKLIEELKRKEKGQVLAFFDMPREQSFITQTLDVKQQKEFYEYYGILRKNLLYKKTVYLRFTTVSLYEIP